MPRNSFETVIAIKNSLQIHTKSTISPHLPERARLKHCVLYSSDFIAMQLGFKARFSRYVSALVSIMCPNKTGDRADCGQQATRVSASQNLT